MARKRSRAGRLRAPLVLTVTAASVSLPGCGGNTTGSDDQSSPPAVSGECAELAGTSCNPTPPPPPPPASDCPLTTPQQRGSCDVDPSAVCEYGDCSGTPTMLASCVQGEWQVSITSCNPPAPTPPVTHVCPPSEPVHGTYCNYDPAGTCGYGDCYGAPITEAQCVGWAWQVTQWSCNPPPPPQCPLDVPVIGTPCWTYAPCYYGECSYDGDSVAECIDGFWQVTTTFCEAPAPQDAGAAPVDGGAP